MDLISFIPVTGAETKTICKPLISVQIWCDILAQDTHPTGLLCSTGRFAKVKTHLLPGTRGLNIYKCKERLYAWDPLKGGVVDWECLFFLSRFTLKIYYGKTNDEKWEMCPTGCLDSSISWLVWSICRAFSDLLGCLCIKSILCHCLVILGLTTPQSSFLLSLSLSN